jgi:hypothetical protein
MGRPLRLLDSNYYLPLLLALHSAFFMWIVLVMFLFWH